MQRLLSRVLLFHSLLLLPFNILRFVKHLMPDWDSETTLDLAFLSLVGLTFSTILVVPIVTLCGAASAYEDSLERFSRSASVVLAPGNRRQQQRGSATATRAASHS